METRRKLNIVLVEYINRNLGDTVLAECAAYFLKKAVKEVGISDFVIHEYNMYLEDMELIRRADLIVFAGGGLIKYKREQFYHYVPQIIETAEKNQIPVFINCTGVEGYDEEDKRCLALKRAVNSFCVKGITVRDDYDTFRKDYIETEKEWLDFVLDSAAFSSLVYNVNRTGKESGKIGLGIVRDGLFSDYGFADVTKQFQLEFWKEVIVGLEAIGYSWEIFTNGLHSDYEFGQELLEYAGVKDRETHIVRRPVEGKELAETIAAYEGVIACRLHANIVAFSVGTPSIGLVWNEKLIQWGEKIGYPERFIAAGDMEAGLVLERLRMAIRQGCRGLTAEELSRIQEPLEGFVKKYGIPLFNTGRGRIEKKTNTNRKDGSGCCRWENILCCKALGGKHMQFRGMNSPDVILDSWEKGFRWFEADLCLTKDGYLVCVNGWREETLKKLGQTLVNKNESVGALYYREFMNAAYYDGHYQTMDYQALLEFVERLSDMRLILDVGNPPYADMLKIIEIIKESLEKSPSLRKRLIMKVAAAQALDAAMGLDMEIMYEVPSDKEMQEMGISTSEVDCICRGEAVQWLAIQLKNQGASGLKGLKAYQKKICAFFSNTLSEAETLLAVGADLIATDYLDVSQLNELFH